jgi:hypothetical protein
MGTLQVTTEDPADLFLELYDAIDDGPFNDQRALRWRRSDRWARDTADLICANVIRTGRAPSELIAPVVAEGERGMFAAMMGLDQALMYADPLYGTPAETGETYDLLFRYLTTGRLNSKVEDGLLLFRLAGVPRPRGLPSRTTAFHLLRVPAAIIDTYKIDFDRLPMAFDIPFQTPSADGRARIYVGCAPMLAGYDEMEISARDDDGINRYRLRPRTKPLQARVRSILAALDRSGATIGILPEATLSDELLATWKDALREQPVAWDSPLTWILVGTGPVGGGDPPFNRAVLLSREGGHELLCYDKHFDFTLTPAQLKRWRLAELIGEALACEDIHRGDRLVIRECLLGRFAILICEDLTRLTDAGAALGHLGVSHVLVPIFSPPIRSTSWDSCASDDAVSQIGTAAIVVANSLAVGRAMELKGALGTCSSAILPEDAGDEWKDVQREIRKCADPERVSLLEVPAVQITKYAG